MTEPGTVRERRPDALIPARPRTEGFDKLLSTEIFNRKSHERGGRINELQRDALLMVTDVNGSARQFFVKVQFGVEPPDISVTIVPTHGEIRDSQYSGDDKSITEVSSLGYATGHTTSAMKLALTMAFDGLSTLGFSPDPQVENMLRTE